jgi:hypothetical protein
LSVSDAARRVPAKHFGFFVRPLEHLLEGADDLEAVSGWDEVCEALKLFGRDLVRLLGAEGGGELVERPDEIADARA